MRTFLSPKGWIGYRMATQLDPLDTLLLTALVYEVGNDIERTRIPQRDYIVLGYRFQPNNRGRLYSKRFTYDTFRKQSLTLARHFQDGWVVMTDIADFYPRLYTHRLENALDEAIPHAHARVITKLIKNWNKGVSFGVPVGLAASRLLAELCISDIDSLLVANQIKYCRYSDDFRLFTSTRSEALERLVFLVKALYNSHRLTLQEAKTEVISANEFRQRFRGTAEQRTRSSLERSFLDIVDHLEIDSYGAIEYEDLDPEQQDAVKELNLYSIVVDQVTRNQRIDISFLGFALRRLSQIGGADVDLGKLLISKIDRLTPVFHDVVMVLGQIKLVDPVRFPQLINGLLSLLDHPHLSHLEYFRVWILILFQDKFAERSSRWQVLYEQFGDSLTRRELLLTMGAANQQAWIRMNKDAVQNLGPWERRAFICAASCLPKDEAKYWFKFVRNHGELDRWIVTWAIKNCISG